MTEPMSEERLAEIRKMNQIEHVNAEAAKALLPLHVSQLLVEVDRLRVQLAAHVGPEPVTDGPEEPFDRLVRLTETHLRLLMAQDFSAPLVDHLRRDDCMHDWSASKPLHGYDDEIECLECGLHVIDGYRPYYPKKAS